MKSFWNKITISILCCAIILPLLNIGLNYYFGDKNLEIANSITLLAVFITILSTFYSNYKSDERVNKQIKISENQFKEQLKHNQKNLNDQLMFNKKQEIYIKLYEYLNEFWELLDYERVEFQINTDPTYNMPYDYISYEDFKKLYHIIYRTYSSPDFLYMSPKIQKIINNFLKYVNNNIEYCLYENYGNIENYQKATKILSEIYPSLKHEIGIKN